MSSPNTHSCPCSQYITGAGTPISSSATCQAAPLYSAYHGHQTMAKLRYCIAGHGDMHRYSGTVLELVYLPLMPIPVQPSTSPFTITITY